MQYNAKDTLFLHADTLKSIPDLSKKEAEARKVKHEITPKKSEAPANKPLGQINGVLDSLINRTDFENDSAWVKIDSTKMAVALAETGKIVSANKPDTIAAGKDTLGITPAIPDSVRMVAPAAADSLTAATDTVRAVQEDIVSLPLKTGANDSLRVSSDTLKSGKENDDKLFMAYHRVRFYKKDLQGLCDSLSYQMKDSLMRLFKDPVLWSDVHQMTSEKIEYRPHKPDPSIARLDNNGFIISMEDSVKFNQISGKTLIGYIYNNELKNIEVNGNAITLYYLKNKDRYSGVNRLESSKISVVLKDSKIEDITFFPKPEGRTVPLGDLTPDDSVLKGFQWRASEKPKDRYDLYPIDEKRKKIADPEKKPAKK
jgi:hypothetical protein